MFLLIKLIEKPDNVLDQLIFKFEIITFHNCLFGGLSSNFWEFYSYKKLKSKLQNPTYFSLLFLNFYPCVSKVFKKGIRLTTPPLFMLKDKRVYNFLGRFAHLIKYPDNFGIKNKNIIFLDYGEKEIHLLLKYHEKELEKFLKKHLSKRENKK